MIVIGRFARRHEGELQKVDGIVMVRVGLGQGLGKRLIRARRQRHFIGVEMQIPVGLQLRRERLFPLQDLTPAIDAIAGELLDTAQPGAEVARGDRDCAVGRLVVTEVRLYTLGEEVLQAAADEPFLVVGVSRRAVSSACSAPPKSPVSPRASAVKNRACSSGRNWPVRRHSGTARASTALASANRSWCCSSAPR